MVPLEIHQFLEGIASAADARFRARRLPAPKPRSNPGARLLPRPFPGQIFGSSPPCPRKNPVKPSLACRSRLLRPPLAHRTFAITPSHPAELRALNRSAVVPHVAGDWTRHDFYAGDLIWVISVVERGRKNTRQGRQRPSCDLRGCFFKVNIRLY